MARKPTIYEALRDKIGREPTHNELTAEVKRILAEASEEIMQKRAAEEKLPWQRRR